MQLEGRGYTVYPPMACFSCVDSKVICSGVNGVKCARCKVRHRVCSLYVSFLARPPSFSLYSNSFSKIPSRAGLKPEPSSVAVSLLKVRSLLNGLLSPNLDHCVLPVPTREFASFPLRPPAPQFRMRLPLLPLLVSLLPLEHCPRLMTRPLLSLLLFEML